VCWVDTDGEMGLNVCVCMCVCIVYVSVMCVLCLGMYALSVWASLLSPLLCSTYFALPAVPLCVLSVFLLSSLPLASALLLLPLPQGHLALTPSPSLA
jgi:hypothetical protein